MEFPVRLRFSALMVLLLACAPLLSACEDNGFLGQLVVSVDTVVVGLPGGNAEGSAVDIVRGESLSLLRNPEQVADAERWDVALRRTDAGLVLRPFAPVASSFRGAGITVATQAFDAIEKAPRGTSSYGTDPVPVTPGAVYILRSRQFNSGGIICVKYAKLRVEAVDEAAGTVRLALLINEGCDDERLAED